MDCAVVQKPVRKGALGTHHVGVLFVCHALAVVLGQGRSIDSVLQLAVRRTFAVRGRAVFVGLGYHGRASGLLYLSPSSKLFGEAFW